MIEKPTTLDAYRLLHNGAIALSQVESNGMRIDTEYLQKAIIKTTQHVQQLNEELKQDKIFTAWKKRFGLKTNIDSNDQLGKVLFEDLKYDCPARTETGKPKTDEATLEQITLPFVVKYFKAKKLKKAVGTYLKGIQRETTRGFMHPNFDLHNARSYRSTSSNPNFQNLPIRDPQIGKIIRTCIIPRYNCYIVEIDYSGIEVSAAYFYHKDPTMKVYLEDKTKDMHRDMAQQCFILPAGELKAKNEEDAKRIKAIRYWGKSGFVFPQFYGDWYLSCAESMWKAITRQGLKLRDDTTIKQHLLKKGIKTLGSLDPKTRPVKGTFIQHIKEVEHDFWNNRFKVYTQWKEDWYNNYVRTGRIETLTGFVIEGIHDRKQIINYPIQGVAFHVLLWSLIRVQKLLAKYKMKTLIIGQIHDSIVADVPKDERKTYLELVQKVTTQDVVKHWPWINTPLEIEAESTPLNRSWFEKEKIIIA